MSAEFKKHVEFIPAWDERDKGYGIRGAVILWSLMGPKGAIHFSLGTNWQLPHVQKEFDNRMIKSPDRISLEVFYHPSPGEVGYHSCEPSYEGQEPFTKECPQLDNKPCYYDTSYSKGKDAFDSLIKEGDKGLWSFLKKEYFDYIDKS